MNFLNAAIAVPLRSATHLSSGELFWPALELDDARMLNNKIINQLALIIRAQMCNYVNENKGASIFIRIFFTFRISQFHSGLILFD
jgi:hypothetical protein